MMGPWGQRDIKPLSSKTPQFWNEVRTAEATGIEKWESSRGPEASHGNDKLEPSPNADDTKRGETGEQNAPSSGEAWTVGDWWGGGGGGGLGGGESHYLHIDQLSC